LDIGAYHAPVYIRTIKQADQTGNYTSLNAGSRRGKGLNRHKQKACAEIAGLDWADTTSVSVDG